MTNRDFAIYVLNQLEKRHCGGEKQDSIISWMNDFADRQDYIGEHDHASILRTMRGLYLSDGLNGCRKYLRGEL